MAQPSTWTFLAEGEVRKELPLADLTLCAGGDDSALRVHRGLLASLSTKLAASLLASPNKELMLPGKNGAQLELLVGWMYHRLRFEDFSLAIVKQLVALATEFEIPALLKDCDAWLCQEVAAQRIIKPFGTGSFASMTPADYFSLWPTVYPGTDVNSLLNTCASGHYASSYGMPPAQFYTILSSGFYTCNGCGSGKTHSFVDRLSAAQKTALEAAYSANATRADGANKAIATCFGDLLLLARTYKLTGLTRQLCGKMEALSAPHAQLVLLAYVVGELKASCIKA
jgi:BTB/POZ domain